MNRNSYSSGFTPLQSTSNAFKTMGWNREQSRSPLYPIGPTLLHQQAKIVQRGVSPYLSRQGMQPPSYEQRYLHQNTTGFGGTTINQKTMGRVTNQTKGFEDREKDLIARNQNQIEEEHKRREQIRNSYERQISSKSALLSRNLQRKQKLLAQIDVLQSSYTQLHEKVMSIQPPHQSISTYEPLDRKQQEIIIMKNRLVTQIREKEEELQKQQEQEQKYWQQQILQKQKILSSIEETIKNKRIELHLQKNGLQKPDYYSLQDEIRQAKYQQFVYQCSQIESKINRITEERQSLLRQSHETFSIRRPQIITHCMKHEELVREKQTIEMRLSELDRVSKEMQETNSNLLCELSRKEEMISKYEADIQLLKDRKSDQQNAMTLVFNNAREGSAEELITGIQREISQVQEELRFQQTTTTRLKGQYQRLYELLCSSATKHLHQTFNTLSV